MAFEEILSTLDRSPREFFSLRQAAKILKVSTKPVRDWTRLKYLIRDGPRLQYSAAELERFLLWLVNRAEPFDSGLYIERLFVHRKPPFPFEKLARSEFQWPKSRTALRPSELAELISCHASLILKAIREGRLSARNPTPYRWEVTRYAWRHAFPFSQISAGPAFLLPPLPRRSLFSTREVADYLAYCGTAKFTLRGVRSLIHQGQLEALKGDPGKRRLFVLRKSLDNFRRSIAKTS